MSSPFTGTVQAKLIDPTLSDFGTQNNPIYTRFALGYQYQVQFITGESTTAGSKVIIPGVIGKSINVFAISFFSGTGVSCTVSFTDGLTGPNIFSVLITSSNQSGIVFSEAVSVPSFLFATSAGNDLAIYLSASVNVIANISYFTPPVVVMPA